MGWFQDLAGFSTGIGSRRKPFVRLFFLVFILFLAPGGCDLFQVSLTEYLQKEQNEPPDTGPWVYVKVTNGKDANSGRSPDTAVKTLGKAVQIWLAEEGSPDARIKLLENIGPGYNEPGVTTSNGRIDFSGLTPPGDGIDTLLLAGDETTTINGDGLRVLYVNNPSKTIILKDLVVTGGSVSGDGGGIRVVAGHLIISGVVIKGNTAGTGGGVYIGGNAVFTMMSGKIHHNTANSSAGKGGGVYVSEDGTFIMTGGAVNNNESGNDGGGVYVTGGNAKIQNGRIGNGNKAKYGGGVFVGALGILELGVAGGEEAYPFIQNNTAEGETGSTGGGLVINGNGSGALATFYHGTVSGNKAADLGGGILVVDGKLNMAGGKVTGNSVDSGKGPGIALEGGSFIMKDRARVLDPDNPVYFHKSGLTIGLDSSLTKPSSDPRIAYVTTNGVDYGPGTAILSSDTPSLLGEYFLYFNVNGGGFEDSLTSDGKIP